MRKQTYEIKPANGKAYEACKKKQASDKPEDLRLQTIVKEIYK